MFRLLAPSKGQLDSKVRRQETGMAHHEGHEEHEGKNQSRAKVMRHTRGCVLRTLVRSVGPCLPCGVLLHGVPNVPLVVSCRDLRINVADKLLTLRRQCRILCSVVARLQRWLVVLCWDVRINVADKLCTLRRQCRILCSVGPCLPCGVLLHGVPNVPHDE